MRVDWRDRVRSLTTATLLAVATGYGLAGGSVDGSEPSVPDFSNGATPAQWWEKIKSEAAQRAPAAPELRSLQHGVELRVTHHPNSEGSLSAEDRKRLAHFLKFMETRGDAMIRKWRKGERLAPEEEQYFTILKAMYRADDDSLLRTRTPANRFPDLIRYAVQRIKLFCSALGKVKIADKLARAGIHIGKTTVQRILKEKPAKEPESPSDDTGTGSRIVAKYPSHTWNADLTAVPISGGFWTPWVPHAIWQRWPVCWWLLNVVDHYSRRSIGFALFKTKPSSEEVTAALDRIMFKERIRPKHMIVDQGPQFDCEHFEMIWCKAMNILPRFGAVNKHGSIAVVERFHRTLKDLLRLITVPEDQSLFTREVDLIVHWYNEHRPHDTLDGKTPNEVYFSRPAANEQPRLEPRKHWPRSSPCAKPHVGIEGDPGDPIIFEIDCLQQRRHLPIIRTQRAA